MGTFSSPPPPPFSFAPLSKAKLMSGMFRKHMYGTERGRGQGEGRGKGRGRGFNHQPSPFTFLRFRLRSKKAAAPATATTTPSREWIFDCGDLNGWMALLPPLLFFLGRALIMHINHRHHLSIHSPNPFLGHKNERRREGEGGEGRYSLSYIPLGPSSAEEFHDVGWEKGMIKVGGEGAVLRTTSYIIAN